ncbi:MAG: imidazole glycerol phosphate synthase subunit HisH [Chloroflexota bacterium]
MITMIDYGIGNLRSVQKALEFVGAEVALTAAADDVLRAEKLVLPGVGAFRAGMDALAQRGLIDPLRKAAASGTPVLGICLGLQLLFESSAEMGVHQGLGLLSGRVVRFAGDGLKVPHMGWNQIEHNGQHPLLQDVPSGAHAYFVHSYYCEPADARTTLAETEYGLRFPALAGRDNVVGIQFHPEKSQYVGLQILKNFVNW